MCFCPPVRIVARPWRQVPHSRLYQPLKKGGRTTALDVDLLYLTLSTRNVPARNMPDIFTTIGTWLGHSFREETRVVKLRKKGGTAERTRMAVPSASTAKRRLSTGGELSDILVAQEISRAKEHAALMFDTGTIGLYHVFSAWVCVSPRDAWVHDVSVYGYVDSWGASMRILNTGQVKYPAYCRRMRILALRSDICVDADVRGMQYPPAVLQRLRHDTYRPPAITSNACGEQQCCQLTLILPHPLTFSYPPSLPLFVPSLLSLSLFGLEMHKQMHPHGTDHSHRPCSRRRLWDTRDSC